MTRGRTWGLILAGCFVALTFWTTASQAAKVRLKNGRLLSGDVTNIKTMVQIDSPGGATANHAIVMIDDGLRRTFVSLHRVQEIINAAPDPEETFEVKHHRFAQAGKRVAALGAVNEKSPWSEFGRRKMTIRAPGGALSIIQGISQITPRFYEVRSLRADAAARLLLDQRYATTSLPSELVRRLLYKCIDTNDPDQRLRVAEFFLQGRRYREAEQELNAIVKKFPELDGIDRLLQQMQQLKAREALTEIKRRMRSGQHEFALRILENFPKEGIAGETMFEIRELIDSRRKTEVRVEKLGPALITKLDNLNDAPQRAALQPVIDEITRDLGESNLGRLAAYTRLASDPAMSDAEKLSLAVSGWLVGAAEATPNVAVSLSLLEVRDLIRQYLTEEIKPQRRQILEQIKKQEGGSPRLVAALIAQMTPPLPPGEAVEGVDGLFELTVPGRGKEPDVTYYVQLPPEYDPYRRYPAVVTLHSALTTPMQQIDWWAGGQSKTGMRLGQGTRHGYIIIAPKWARDDQRTYNYSGREHLAVLDSLRDASRRFSIDTDRVFISGHSMGGNAAWDMGLAHPDLWAGVVPIVAEVDAKRFNYNALYWRNARGLPLYFVGGTLDGQKSIKNAPQYDRYLGRIGFDATVVEYLGRGQESYADEVQRIFEWMNLRKRNFYPRDFAAATFRSFDNFFWFLEVEQFKPGQILDPEEWGDKGGVALKVHGKINSDSKGKTTVRVQSGGGPTTVWLSPEWVDFEKPLIVSVRNLGRQRNPQPDVEVLLDDVRTRGDRQHPFWAKVEFGRDR